MQFLRFRRIAPCVAVAALAAGCSHDRGPTAPAAPNHGPTATVDVSRSVLAYGDVATVRVDAIDPDGDPLIYSYSATGGTVAWDAGSPATAVFTPAPRWGPASVTAIAADGRGGRAVESVWMYIRNPSPPKLTVRAVTAQCDVPFTVDFAAVPDEDVLVTRVRLLDGSPDTTGAPFVPPLVLHRGTSTVLPAPACLSRGGPWVVVHYDLELWLRRPEPDGGEFRFVARGL